MLIYLVFLIVCFGASIVGAICGIGGGVIIKPVLDSFGVLDVTAISFLSGCTVLSMTTYSVLKNKISGESHVTMKTGFPLAIGAAVGGLIGKWLFSYVKSLSSDPNKVGAVQALCLLIVTLGTLIYTIYKAKIKTYEVDSAIVCVLIGIFLGIMSSFLGIGGGPIFSQIASLISTIVTGSVPDFQIGVLVLMVAGGIAGGICGRAINKKIDEKTVDKLFIALMVLMIVINIYNIYKFM